MLATSDHLLNRLVRHSHKYQRHGACDPDKPVQSCGPSNNSHATGDTHKAAKNTAPFVFDI